MCELAIDPAIAQASKQFYANRPLGRNSTTLHKFNWFGSVCIFLGNVIKVAIVINSLSRLLLWKSTSTVCTLLNQLYSNPPDSQTGMWYYLWQFNVSRTDPGFSLREGVPLSNVVTDCWANTRKKALSQRSCACLTPCTTRTAPGLWIMLFSIWDPWARYTRFMLLGNKLFCLICISRLSFIKGQLLAKLTGYEDDFAHLGRVVWKLGNANSGLKVNWGSNFFCIIKVLSIAYVLCTLKLLMLKTEGQKVFINRTPCWKATKMKSKFSLILG